MPSAASTWAGRWWPTWPSRRGGPPPITYSDSDWHGAWNGEGGAALINRGIHGVDLMLWIAGPIT